ncbi:MAG: hypothetical protein GF347_04235 [Candidatus Moranbacteria bacterium]|nr:hypothetical protein [Candidatus Moranbacteria bacterium]
MNTEKMIEKLKIYYGYHCKIVELHQLLDNYFRNMFSEKEYIKKVLKFLYTLDHTEEEKFFKSIEENLLQLELRHLAITLIVNNINTQEAINRYSYSDITLNFLILPKSFDEINKYLFE